VLFAGALSNFAVVGAGLALFEDRPRAMIAGGIAIGYRRDFNLEG
jgi:hypothetical protein